MGVGPEQRSEPAEDETAAPPRPGRTGESAVESRMPELRLQRHVGNGAIAEHPVTQMPAATVSGKASPCLPPPCPPPCPTKLALCPPPPCLAPCPPPPWPPPPWPPPPCPPPPPFASASSVIRGTTRSSIAAMQAPVVNTGLTALRDWTRRTPRSTEPWHTSTNEEPLMLTSELSFSRPPDDV